MPNDGTCMLARYCGGYGWPKMVHILFWDKMNCIGKLCGLVVKNSKRVVKNLNNKELYIF